MKNIIIIGAGPAGLTAAAEIVRLDTAHEFNVTILEKTQEFGGISRTVRHNGNRMDIGGHRFFSKDERVCDMWKRLMPLQGKPSFDDIMLQRDKPLVNGGPDPESDDRVMLIRDRVSRIYYLNTFFDYPISLKFATLRSMGFLNTMAVGFSYLHSCIAKKPETSLENFYINRFGKKLYSMFFEDYTEKLWGRHPRDISADWGSQRVKGLSVLGLIKNMFRRKSKNNKEVETSLIEQFWYPKFGPGQLWETVAAELENSGVEILRDHDCKSLSLSNGIISSVCVSTPDGERSIDADIVISSMPVRDLVCGIKGDVPPQSICDIAAGLPYRDFVTVGLLVNKLNLKNTTDMRTLGNIVPDCWIYVQERSCKLGRLQIFNNWSPYMVKDPEHTVWIGLEYFCDEGDDFWNMSEEDCVRFATKELVDMGIIDENVVLDAHRERVQKAYPAYFDTYSQMDELIDYLNTISNLYCVGRNGQHRYNNMDHSMATSMLAAEHIVCGAGNKEDIWKVNTEKEYHETKSTANT